MEASHQLILAGAALVAFSILLGQLSTRFGAPLLLVFLAIGMLAGEDGPGGILFSDYNAAFVIGSLALAVILFDGGLRTSRDTLRLRWGPPSRSPRWAWRSRQSWSGSRPPCCSTSPGRLRS